MATREDVYTAVGSALEKAQLLEHELGTTLLAFDALETKSFLAPDPSAYLRLSKAIESKTLGGLLKQIKAQFSLHEDIESIYELALDQRNHLAHEFYPKHGVDILSPEGRDRMAAHAQRIHVDIDAAYQLSQHVSQLLVGQVLAFKKARQN